MKSRVLITGGSRGIGAATGLAFAREGFEVVLVSRTLSDLEASAQRIRQEFPGSEIMTIAADVSDEAQVLSIFNQVDQIDVLINNAGYIRVTPVEDLSLEEWRRTIDINLTSCFLMSRELIRRNKTNRNACIINISSLGGIQGKTKFPGFLAYSSAKAGVIALTECLAVEAKTAGIRVNCIAPGTVNTRMLQEALPGIQTTTQPEDIAEEILYFVIDPVGKTLTGEIKELVNA